MTDWRLLEGVPEEDVRRVLAAARRRRFARGEVVFHRGDPADTLHLIRSGRFGVKVITRMGETALLAVMCPGDAFGELALVGERHRSATVVALEASQTECLTQPDFARLRREHPSVTDAMISLLAGQVLRLSEHLVAAMYEPAEKRLLRSLGDLAMVYSDGSGEATIELTQEDLAGLAGTSRATVNRVLRQEAVRGTLRLGRGKVIVVDGPELARRARSVR